jgi:hypothetical protein
MSRLASVVRSTSSADTGRTGTNFIAIFVHGQACRARTGSGHGHRPDVAALEGRTEGWIAALQLAALSMRGRGDIAGFSAGFTEDDGYIIDYLLEEVLQRQPDSPPGARG